MLSNVTKSVFIFLIFPLSICLSYDETQLEQALDRWDIEKAREILTQYQGREVTPKVRSLLGYIKFLEGDYADAYSLLREGGKSTNEKSHAGVGGLSEIVAFSLKVTQMMTIARSVSGRFHIFYKQGEDDVLVPYVGETAEASFLALSKLLPQPLETPIRIEILPDLETLAGMSGLSHKEIKSSGTVGICKFRKIMIVTPRYFPYGYPYLDTVAHELTHYFLIRYAGYHLPVWFQEGVAKYSEMTWRGLKPGLMTQGMYQLLADAVTNGKLIPFDAFSESFASIGSVESAALAYAEVSSFIQYLVNRYGDQVLAKLAYEIGLYGEGAGFVKVVGNTLTKETQTWANELMRKGLSDHKRVEFGQWVLLKEGEYILPSLNKDDVQMIKLGDALFRLGRPKAASLEYSKVRSSHPFVILKKARAMIEYDPLGVLQLLEKASLDEMEFGEIAGIKGRALVMLGRYSEAIEPLLVAIGMNPFDAKTHLALAEAYKAINMNSLSDRETKIAATLSHVR